MKLVGTGFQNEAGDRCSRRSHLRNSPTIAPVMPDSSPETDPIAAAIAAYLVAVDSGEYVDREAFAARYPESADGLREFWRDHDRMLSGSDDGRLPETLSGKSHDRSTRTFSPLLSVARPRGDHESSGPFVEFPRPFGPYELLALIDRGGMGVVYRARDTRLDRIVALKTIRSGVLAGPDEVARFRTENAAAAGLHHPAIVPLYEVGEIDGLQYCTMSCIDGENLARRIERSGPLEPREGARIVARVARAIDAAHSVGIVHRDLKPANVLIDAEGNPFVIDFGLARRLSTAGTTIDGEILGTPAYMAPEQASGRGSDTSPAIDVYGLGALLYTLLIGRPPFGGSNTFEILLQVLDREPARLRQLRRDVPRDLERLCRRAMAKSPADRYPSASALANDLERFLRDEPLESTRLEFGDLLRQWWRREPILACHLVVLLGVAGIIAITAALRDGDVGPWPLKLSLIGALVGGCWLLQKGVRRPRLHDASCLAWAAMDVVGSTMLIALADPPRGLLTMTYPLLIVASGLFYRVSWVAFMTTVCIVGFLGLVTLAPEPEFARLDFCAMFVVALVTMGLAIGSIIRRVRGLLSYCDDSG